MYVLRVSVTTFVVLPVLLPTMCPPAHRTLTAHIPYLWHKGRDFIKRDPKGKEAKVGVGVVLLELAAVSVFVFVCWRVLVRDVS